MWFKSRIKSLRLKFWFSAFRLLLWQWASIWNIKLGNSLCWPIYIVYSVYKSKLSCNTLHQCSTSVSSDTHPFHEVLNTLLVEMWLSQSWSFHNWGLIGATIMVSWSKQLFVLVLLDSLSFIFSARYQGRGLQVGGAIVCKLNVVTGLPYFAFLQNFFTRYDLKEQCM